MLALLLLVTIWTTSCVGIRQINELAIVTAVGLDVGEKPETVKLSAQIIRPADARGQTGAPAGGTGQPIYSISAEGRTIFEAIRNLGRFSSRRVYWAHNFLIVMHEDYARRSIKDMVDFFTRNHELRMNTWVAVTPDPPEELIATITGLEVVPGEAVDRLFRNNEVVGQAPASNMMNLEEAVLSRSVQPVLARLQLVSRGISNKKPEEHGSIKQVELAGAAAFKEDKMIGWLSIKEARGLMFFLEKLQSGIEVLACPNNSGAQMAVEFKYADLKVTPYYRDEKPQFQIRLTADADIVESTCSISFEEIRQGIEEKLEQRLKYTIESAIGKAQMYHSDFLKLGDVFRNHYPAEWRGLGSRWDKVFSEAETNVQVKTTIKSAVVKAARQGIK